MENNDYNLANRLISRKFILALLAIAADTWLCAAGHIADGVWSSVAIATVGAYIVGNVYQNVQFAAKQSRKKLTTMCLQLK